MTILEDAQTALQQKDFQKANKLFSQVLKEYPNNVIVLQGLAESSFRLRKIDTAIRYANESLLLESELPRSHLILAYSHANKREFEKGILAVQKALSIEPNNADALAFLGGLFITQNKIPEAWESIQKALQIDKSNSIAHYNSGLVYANVAHKSSFKAYQKAIDEFHLSFRSKPDLHTFLRLVECYGARYFGWVILIILFSMFISARIPQVWWLFLVPFSFELLIGIVRFVIERSKRDILFIALISVIMFWYAQLFHR